MRDFLIFLVQFCIYSFIIAKSDEIPPFVLPFLHISLMIRIHMN